MKKTISLALCFCLMACLATVSFAATDINTNFQPILTSKNDGNTYIGVLDALNFADDEKALYTEFVKAFTGEYRDPAFQYFSFIRNEANDPNNAFLIYIKMPASVQIATSVNGSGYRILTTSSGCKISSISWSTAAGKNDDGSIKRSGIKIDSFNMSGYSFLVFGNGKNVILSHSGNLNLGPSVTSAIAEPLNHTQIGSLFFVDNIPDDVTPPTPEPDPPLPPVNPPKLPEIPKGNPEYVPYDTSTWLKFLTHVAGSIGSSTNVGFILLAIVLGLSVVIRIITNYTKKGAEPSKVPRATTTINISGSDLWF